MNVKACNDIIYQYNMHSRKMHTVHSWESSINVADVCGFTTAVTIRLTKHPSSISPQSESFGALLELIKKKKELPNTMSASSRPLLQFATIQGASILSQGVRHYSPTEAWVKASSIVKLQLFCE